MEFYERICSAAGWEWAWHEKLEWGGGWGKRIMVKLPGTTTITEFVLDHNMAALLREEIERRGLEDEFVELLGDNDWSRISATPEHTATVFLSVVK